MLVVSFNIQLSFRISQAVRLFREDPQLRRADVICLQEMTEKGVRQFAGELGYHHIYYPAGGHLLHPLILGNAVLSRTPITDDSEWVLRHPRKRGRRRNAAAAVLQIDGKELLVFSIHKEVALKPAIRQQQAQDLLESIDSQECPCVVAGDFNTFRRPVLRRIVQTFERNGFHLATSAVSWTHKTVFFLNRKSNLDHIFARGLRVESAGVVVAPRASDHVPVWAELTLEG